MFKALIDEDGITVRVQSGPDEDNLQYVGVLAFPDDPTTASDFASQINGA